MFPVVRQLTCVDGVVDRPTPLSAILPPSSLRYDLGL